jgi:putative endonuclease
LIDPGAQRGVKRGCYCYILKCSDGSFYTGWTMDPEHRLKEHNAGRGSRYTRARRPVQLAWLEPEMDRRTAMRRERAIKTMTRARKLRLIAETPIVGKSRKRATGTGRIRRA